MTTGILMDMAITTIMSERRGEAAPDGTNIRAALRLQSWLSPSFPIGAYSYSHGVEAAIESGLIDDAASLEGWLGGLLRFGSGRNDAILLSEAWRCVRHGEHERLAELAEFAAALVPTSELRLESASQGAAFAKTVGAAWPEISLPDLPRETPLAVIYGAVCGRTGIALELAGPLYLQAFAHNLVSAAVRAVPLGQTDGQKVVARLEAVIEMVWEQSSSATLEDIGSAALMAEWSSLQHEAMDGRLFRS